MKRSQVIIEIAEITHMHRRATVSTTSIHLAHLILMRLESRNILPPPYNKNIPLYSTNGKTSAVFAEYVINGRAPENE